MAFPPTTTVQQDLTTEGQRKINLIWERTQSLIAIMVVFANMIYAILSALSLMQGGKEIAFPNVLSGAMFLVVGFYFARTNHSTIGGIGPKPDQPYIGR